MPVDSRDSDKVIVRLYAGLGNNVLQIIAGYALSLRLSKLHNCEYGGHLRRDDHYTQNHRDHNLPSPFDLKEVFPMIEWISFENTAPPNQANQNDNLSGLIEYFSSIYFSSERYLNLCREEKHCIQHDKTVGKFLNNYFVRTPYPFYQEYWYPEVKNLHRLFTPTESIMNYIRSEYNVDIKENLIGIHVRNDQRVADIHESDKVSIQWYVDSLKKIVKCGEKAKVVIVSNTVANNQKSFDIGRKLKNEVARYSSDIEIIESNQEPYYIDFFLLAMCSYLIISSSTFGFSAGITSQNTKKIYLPNVFSDRHFLNYKLPDFCRFIPDQTDILTPEV